jgi:hypothetical protein
MTVGRCVSDLQAGDPLGALECQVTPFVTREFCHSVELHHEIFHGGRDGVQRVPAPLIFAHKLRLLKEACPAGDGPAARVLAMCRIAWDEPLAVTDRLIAEGRIADRFVKRGRERIRTEMTVRGADDKRVRARLVDEAVFAGPSDGGRSETTAKAGRAEDGAARAGDGAVLRFEPRRMTRERIRWYCDAQETAIANDGRLHVAAPNIHNDDAFAVAQGLPGIVGFAMVLVNWMFGHLLDAFGEGVLDRGSLQVKFVRPVLVDQVIATSFRRAPGPPGADGAAMLEIWCEDEAGRIVAAGTASIPAAEPGRDKDRRAKSGGRVAEQI